MRTFKALTAILSPMLLAGVLCLGLYLPGLLETHTQGAHGTVTNPLDGPISNLPMCTSEAGEGMALCVWSAGVQGNGEGTTVVSGDCAPNYVGNDLMRMCISAHDIDSSNVQDCNSEFLPNAIVELKNCYAKLMN